jgi:hypothetical protein
MSVQDEREWRAMPVSGIQDLRPETGIEAEQRPGARGGTQRQGWRCELRSRPEMSVQDDREWRAMPVSGIAEPASPIQQQFRFAKLLN